jgi:hypothetical protein
MDAATGPTEVEPTDRFPSIGPMAEVRGLDAGGALAPGASGAALDAIVEAAPDLKAAIVASGRPAGVVTCDLLTYPYPTSFGLWRAARSPAPLLWLTARMLVVQWEEEPAPTRRGRGGRSTAPDAPPRRRTLLWSAGDLERAARTPLAVRLRAARPPLPDRLVTEHHGSVLGHLQALGIDPLDVDYVAFDHLQVRDPRRLLGTLRPAPDLDAPEAPLRGWFPNASLLTTTREWDTLRRLHPLQAPWYQPAAFRDLDPQRVALVTGDVQLGPGVALVSTPGHTAGSVSLVLNTDDGVWVSSSNGVAAECYAPRASRIPGLRRYAEEWGQEVVLHGNTPEFAARHYDSMVLERELADPAEGGPFPRCFPIAELTASRFAPGLTPTHVHGAVRSGVVRGALDRERVTAA